MQKRRDHDEIPPPPSLPRECERGSWIPGKGAAVGAGGLTVIATVVIAVLEATGATSMTGLRSPGHGSDHAQEMRDAAQERKQLMERVSEQSTRLAVMQAQLDAMAKTAEEIRVSLAELSRECDRKCQRRRARE